MSLRNKSKVISQLWIKSVRLSFATPVSSHLKNIMTYRVVFIESGVHRLRAKDLYLNRAREETVFCEKINSYKLFHPHTHISTATNVFFPIILFFFFHIIHDLIHDRFLSCLFCLVGLTFVSFLPNHGFLDVFSSISVFDCHRDECHTQLTFQKREISIRLFKNFCR